MREINDIIAENLKLYRKQNGYSLEQLPFIILLAVIGFFGTLSWGVLGTLFKSFIATHERLFNFVMAGLLVYVALNILMH